MATRRLARALWAGLAAFPLGFATGAAAEVPTVAAPVVHENVAVYLLKGTSAPGPVPLTLAEGLAKGVIEVTETGNVRELRIENKGAEAVFVQFGDIVKGGRQDRVLTVSLLLQPKSGVVPIGAYCVERGRWSARGGEDAKTFALSEALLPSREAKVAIARSVPEVRAAGLGGQGAGGEAAGSPIENELRHAQQRDAQLRTAQALRSLDGQGEVWRNVDQLQRQLSDKLATQVANDRSRTSLQLSLENEKLKTAQAAYQAALEPAGLKGDDVVGVAIAIGGRIASAEVYPSNGLFRKMWPKLVGAAATEAIALGEKAVPGKAPSVEDVAAFLRTGEAAKPIEHALGSHAKVETRQTEKVMSVRTLAPQGLLVHQSYLAN